MKFKRKLERKRSSEREALKENTILATTIKETKAMHLRKLNGEGNAWEGWRKKWQVGKLHFN